MRTMYVLGFIAAMVIAITALTLWANFCFGLTTNMWVGGAIYASPFIVIPIAVAMWLDIKGRGK